MQKRRFREEQIIGILQEVEAGATIREMCRRTADEEDLRKAIQARRTGQAGA